MKYFENVNEIAAQMSGIASVSLGDVAGSLFMHVVSFFLNVLLGV